MVGQFVDVLIEYIILTLTWLNALARQEARRESILKERLELSSSLKPEKLFIKKPVHEGTLKKSLFHVQDFRYPSHNTASK